jgi:Uncharacterized conserved protein
MKKEFVITEDGSHTIYLPELDEHYHSTHGAIQESLHIYIGNGFLNRKENEVNILEIGFGTGLNALLTYIYATRNNKSVKYWSIEKFPLTANEYHLLNYTNDLYKEYTDVFGSLHSSPWDKDFEIDKNFTLHKVKADLTDSQLNFPFKFALVYYDAFAPNKQADLWTEEIIKKVSDNVVPGGTVVTYCAKGSVRRAFAAAGFEVERLPGPPGKKEIIRGKKLH